MQLVDINGVELHIIEDEQHEFLLSTYEVALGYGVDEKTIRSTKSRHEDEFVEDKHYKGVANCNTLGGMQTKTFWTKKGIVRLGFFIKSEQAKKFRDWAEEYIVSGGNDTKAPLLKYISNENNNILGMMKEIRTLYGVQVAKQIFAPYIGITQEALQKLPTYSNTKNEHMQVLNSNMKHFVTNYIDFDESKYTSVDDLHKYYCELYGDISKIEFGKAFKNETDILSSVKKIGNKATRVYQDVLIKQTIEIAG